MCESLLKVPAGNFLVFLFRVEPRGSVLSVRERSRSFSPPGSSLPKSRIDSRVRESRLLENASQITRLRDSGSPEAGNDAEVVY